MFRRANFYYSAWLLVLTSIGVSSNTSAPSKYTGLYITTLTSLHHFTMSNITDHQYPGEECLDSSQCVSPRICTSVDTNSECTSSDQKCICYSPSNVACTTSNDCLPGDRCTVVTGEVWCVSCSFDSLIQNAVDAGNCNSVGTGGSSGAGNGADNGGSGSGNPPPGTGGSPGSGAGTSGEVKCISVDALSDLDRESLVFTADRRAAVLCDQFDNCATPGHMVMYRARPMMMKTYCLETIIKCVYRVKLVNSPRMKLGIRILSRSNHLQFTALAAAKETIFEEMILRTVIEAGI